MLETIIHWIATHGYGVIFILLMLGIFGIPLPDEWLLAYCGYLVYKGKLLFFPTVIAAALGSICGITLSYGLGRSFGVYLIKKYGRFVQVSSENMEGVQLWFERAGKWGLLFGYFLPGIRHLTAFVAGASKFELAEFALFSYTGALIWSVAFITLGYFLGEEWSRVTEKIRFALIMGSGVVIAALLVYFIVRRGKAGPS